MKKEADISNSQEVPAQPETKKDESLARKETSIPQQEASVKPPIQEDPQAVQQLVDAEKAKIDENLRGKGGIQMAAEAGIIGGVIAAGVHAVKEAGRREIGREASVVVVETGRATYQVVHGDEKNPKTFKGADGGILSVGNVVQFDGRGNLESHVNKVGVKYREIFDAAREHKKPLFFTDPLKYVNPEEINKEISEKGSMVLINLLIGAGVVLTDRAIKSVNKSRNKTEPTRRDFISTSAKILGAGWFFSPMLERWGKRKIEDTEKKGLVKSVIEKTGWVKKSKKHPVAQVDSFFHDVNEIIHPELRLKYLKAKNEITAQDAEVIANALAAEKGEKPTLNIYTEEYNIGLEKTLQEDGEDRDRHLRETLGEDFNRKDDRIIRIDFDGKGKPVISLVKMQAIIKE